MEIDVSKGFDLGCFHYRVVTGEEVDVEMIGRDEYGEHSQVGRLIKVAGNYGVDQFHKTFVHECIEAVQNTLCNNNMKHNDIENLSQGLAQVLKSMGVMFVVGNSSCLDRVAEMARDALKEKNKEKEK